MQLLKDIDAVVADFNPPKEKTSGFSSAEVKRFAALTNLDDATRKALRLFNIRWRFFLRCTESMLLRSPIQPA
jgi:hypothetical protein